MHCACHAKYAIPAFLYMQLQQVNNSKRHKLLKRVQIHHTILLRLPGVVLALAYAYYTPDHQRPSYQENWGILHGSTLT